MVSLAERLDGIRVRVDAPGLELVAELRGKNAITLHFGESVYEFVSEPVLERALANVARLLWAGWQREYLAAVDGTSLNVHPDDQHDFNFVAERDAVSATGTSEDGRITIASTGLRDFSVRIKPETVREIPETAFIAGVSQAAGTLVHDFQEQVAEVKARYYP